MYYCNQNHNFYEMQIKGFFYVKDLLYKNSPLPREILDNIDY